MKTAGTIIVTLITVAAVSSPALAGKRKGKGKKARAAAAAEVVEAPRRLGDELGLVSVAAVAAPTAAAAAPAKKVDLDAAAADAERALARAAAFELTADRSAASPTGDAAPEVELRPLTQDEIARTIQARADELGYCWLKVPASKREALSVGLAFTIQPEGTVAAVKVVGEAPAKFSSCVTAVAKRWTFPHADTATEVEYPLMFQ
jgi:hypothetical protein